MTGRVVDADVANPQSFEEEVVYRGHRRFRVRFQVIESRVRLFRQMFLKNLN